MIIGHVVFAWAPMDAELALLDAVLDPIEAHVEGFGALLVDSIVGDAVSCEVVGDDGSRGLWVAHILEALANDNSGFAIVVETTELSFCRRRHDVLEDRRFNVNWVLVKSMKVDTTFRESASEFHS